MKAGWTEVAFDEACVDVSRRAGRLPKDSWHPTGAIPIIDQGNGAIAGYTDERDLAFESDLPVIVFGDHTCRFKYVDQPFVAGADGIKILAPSAGFDPRYLFWFLQTVALPQASYSRHFKFLKCARIPRPPLDEQHRISRILDAVDAVRARRQRSLSVTRTLARAAMPADVGDHVALGDLLDRIDSGRSPVCEARPARDEEWGVLKLGAVSSGEFRPSENKAMLKDDAVDESLGVSAGDILLARKNTLELVGASAFVPTTPSQMLLPDLIFRLVLRSDAPVTPRYLQAALARPVTRNRLRRIAGGSAGSMPNISKARLLTVAITLPPLDVQERFDEASRIADAVLGSGRRHLAELDALVTSLQHRAFAGEL